jgi:hypothetical protein
MAGHLSNAEGLPESSREMERRGNNNAADLRDGDGVERVGNVWTRPDL